MASESERAKQTRASIIRVLMDKPTSWMREQLKTHGGKRTGRETKTELAEKVYDVLGLANGKAGSGASGERVCPKCKTAKPLAEFGERKVGGKVVPQSWCRPCRSAASSEARKIKKDEPAAQAKGEG